MAGMVRWFTQVISEQGPHRDQGAQPVYKNRLEVRTTPSKSDDMSGNIPIGVHCVLRPIFVIIRK